MISVSTVPGLDDADADALADQLLPDAFAERVDAEFGQRVHGRAGRATLPAVELIVTTSATPRGESAAAAMRWGSEARVCVEDAAAR